jgi:DME family drug/metabolite transporter
MGRPVAILCIVAAAVLFGSTGTAQELGPDGTTPMGVGAVRILIGSVALWAMVGRRPRSRAIAAHRAPLLAGAAGVAVYQPGFFTGTERLGVALGTIAALGSGPIFAGVLAWAAGTRPSLRWRIATGLAIVGGSLVVFSGASGASFDAVGLVGALGAGLGYAVYATATKRMIGAGVDSTEASAWQFSLAALALVPFVVFEPLDWLGSASGLAMAIHLGVFCTGLAYLLYGLGLRTIDATTATTLTLAEPVTAAALAVLVLDERLAWFGWIGTVLVLVGLSVVGGGARTVPWRRSPTPRWTRDVGS